MRVFSRSGRYKVGLEGGDEAWVHAVHLLIAHEHRQPGQRFRGDVGYALASDGSWMAYDQLPGRSYLRRLPAATFSHPVVEPGNWRGFVGGHCLPQLFILLGKPVQKREQVDMNPLKQLNVDTDHCT